MDIKTAVKRMKKSARAVQALVEDLDAEQARWRENAETWSITEVVNHLYDEEREDFRVRLDIILRRSLDPWPAIDPAGWVTARKYNERDLAESLANFLAEREKSIAWLESLEEPDLSIDVKARFGRIAAGDMLSAWVAHDLLHIRQLMEIRYAYQLVLFAPFKPDYAGEF